jgi:hypothetical protein
LDDDLLAAAATSLSNLGGASGQGHSEWGIERALGYHGWLMKRKQHGLTVVGRSSSEWPVTESRVAASRGLQRRSKAMAVQGLVKLVAGGGRSRKAWKLAAWRCGSTGAWPAASHQLVAGGRAGPGRGIGGMWSCGAALVPQVYITRQLM